MLDGEKMGNAIANAVIQYGGHSDSQGSAVCKKYWVLISTEICNHIKSNAIVMSAGMPTAGHVSTTPMSITGLDGTIMGNAIASSVISYGGHSDSQGSTLCRKYWVLISTEICNHIMDSGKIAPGISGNHGASTSNGNFLSGSLDGDVLGNAIARSVISYGGHSDSQGSALCRKYWVLISTEICNHIMDNAEVPPGIGHSCVYGEHGCTNAGVYVSNGKIT